jgi:hypothetical protein
MLLYDKYSKRKTLELMLVTSEQPPPLQVPRAEKWRLRTYAMTNNNRRKLAASELASRLQIPREVGRMKLTLVTTKATERKLSAVWRSLSCLHGYRSLRTTNGGCGYTQ